MSTNVQSYPPIQSPMVDQSGNVTPVWSKWFNTLFIQTGTSTSTALTSLITTVAAQTVSITTINATLLSLQSQITIGVGRQL